MNRNRYSDEKAKIRICMETMSREQGVRGEVNSIFLKEPLEFTNVVSMVLQIEKILNLRGFPHAHQLLRSFGKSKENTGARTKKQEIEIYQTEEELSKRAGKSGTFWMYITSRRSVTWKGYVVSVEDGSIHKFQSELEFIELWRK